MNIIKKSSVAALLSIFALSAFVSVSAQAESNPFATKGHVTIVAQDDEKKGKCGEGKCGEGKAKKAMKGKCGEGKCGGDKKAGKEGKCGEGKCGSM
ncbi:HvfA family oxazolone/thioamide-modified RiPP metallophore [Alteromonas sp.]|uniref:HvfA family oxazolone/thioamide-modified RiPP metallophore n=1 Tax=Alteromonas sp. TaxID=232 RepID=UPI00257E33F0|nr:hypothetical protein [Alteromonas sp.]NQY16185.1 hypothetical protein [Alteromonas sp.]